MGALVRVDGRRRVRRRPARRATHRRRHARARRGGTLRVRQSRADSGGAWWGGPRGPRRGPIRSRWGSVPSELDVRQNVREMVHGVFRSRGESRWPRVVHLLVRAPVANEIHGEPGRRRAQRGSARACGDAAAASCSTGSLVSRLPRCDESRVVAFCLNGKICRDAPGRHSACHADGFPGRGRSAGAARTGWGTSGAAGWTRQSTRGGSEAFSRPCAPTIGPRARGEKRGWSRTSKSNVKSSAGSTRRPRWRGCTRALPETTTTARPREARDTPERER